jgi:glycine cleavage system regulatory protein
MKNGKRRNKMEETVEQAPAQTGTLSLPVERILEVMAGHDPKLFELAKQTVRADMLEQMLKEAQADAAVPCTCSSVEEHNSHTEDG